LTLCFPRCGVKTCPIYSWSSSAFIHPGGLWPTSQSTESLSVISDGIHLYGYIIMGGLGSIVCIATAYGLEGPGIESRWRRDLLHLSTPALRPTQPPVQWVPGLSRG
jgi:hypothetical protein